MSFDKFYDALCEETSKSPNDAIGLSVKHYCHLAFQAGAASRDAEVAELAEALGNVTVHLVAAHSLLSRGGKKAAASDTIFKIMLQDYEKSFEAGRKALAKARKPTFFEAGRQSVIEGCDDGTIDWRGENEV